MTIVSDYGLWARCLALLDEVARAHHTIVVTKHGSAALVAGSTRPKPAGGISASAWERITEASFVLVSPISCWKVGMLVAKERVRLDRPTAAWIPDLVAGGGIGIAELAPGIAVAAAEPADFHGDSADRFLYATARCLDVSLLSKDRLLHDYVKVDHFVTVLW
jgi:PIN domain nuclease of toxin-antitoxin system